MKNTQMFTAVMISFYFTSSVASPTKPTAPNQSNCDSSLEDQNLPHHSDCSKYYRCVYGKKVPKICPEKMLFNPSIGNCDLYYNVDCAKRPDDEQQEQNLDEAIENLTGRGFMKNPKVSVSSTTVTDDVSSVERNTVTQTKSGETTTIRFVYVPHENDHTAYYKIENGRKLLMHCEEGMMFSFEMEICARPWDLK